jgi:hypothetical protein
MATFLLRNAIFWSLVLLLSYSSSFAQLTSAPYSSYRFDSAFVLGGYDLNRTWLLERGADSLRFNTVAFYGAPTDLDSATVAYYLDNNHLDSGYKVLRQLVDLSVGRTRPIKFLYTPSMIGAIGKTATALEPSLPIMSETAGHR